MSSVRFKFLIVFYNITVFSVL